MVIMAGIVKRKVLMRVIETISDLQKVPRGCVLTIGNFDGVHVGHRKILRTAREIADRRGSSVVMMTFEPHPLAVLHPEKVPAKLTPMALKRRLLMELNVDCRLVIKATSEVLGLSARDFVRRFLIEGVQPSVVVEGEDFYFGAGRDGNIGTLAEMSGENGFELVVVEEETIRIPGGQTLRVSSTMVRYMLEGGEVGDAAMALGRYYRLIGEVVKGRGVGRDLGYPTANMKLPDQLIPGEGVYAGFVQLADDVDGVCGNGEKVAAVFSIGQVRTFGEDHPLLIEAHLLADSVGELAGEFMAMDFVERLRGQFKFENREELIRQIGKDCERARGILEVRSEKLEVRSEKLEVRSEKLEIRNDLFEINVQNERICEMAGLPEVVSTGWENHEGAAVLTTVDGQGLPNSVYVGCVKIYDEQRIVVADNYFNKTRENILSGSKGAFLFITKEGKAYQVKGSIEYQTSGEIYDDMKKWNDSAHPGVAATILHVDEVYSGAEKLA